MMPGLTRPGEALRIWATGRGSDAKAHVLRRAQCGLRRTLEGGPATLSWGAGEILMLEEYELIWPSWLRSRRIGTCAEADRGRRKNTMIFSGGAALSSPLLLLAVLEDPVIFLAYLPLGGMFTIYAVSLIRLRHYMRAGRSLWSATESGVVMEVPRELMILDLAPWVLYLSFAFSGAFEMICSDYLPGSFLGVAFVLSSVGAVRCFWRSLPARERILVTGEGVRLTRITGQSSFIPWSQKPSASHVNGGDLLVNTQGRVDEMRFPMSLLPVSCRQFQRLLDTFSRSVSKRHRLDGPYALQTVLDVLESTEEEYSDSSWSWACPEVSQGAA